MFSKKPEKKSVDGEFEGIKARDPHNRHGSKDFDTEEQEVDKEDHPSKEKENE